MKKKPIRVPDLSGPRVPLCWAQAETMERCTIKRGHRGPHIWELTREIKALYAMLAELEHGRSR